MQYSSAFIIILIFTGVAVSTWIRAKYGYPLDDGAGNAVHREDTSRGDVVKTVDAALAARDKRIAALEKRVRVLERIATDRRTALDEEIEDLRA